MNLLAGQTATAIRICRAAFLRLEVEKGDRTN
jgi:hypothetical protein